MSTQLVIVLLLLTGSCLSLASGLFGGDTDIDVNDDDIQKLAKAAVDQLNARSNSMFKSKLVTLKSAKVQVS